MLIKIETWLCGGLYKTETRELNDYLHEFYDNEYNEKWTYPSREEIVKRIGRGETIILQNQVINGDIIMPQYDEEFHLKAVK